MTAIIRTDVDADAFRIYGQAASNITYAIQADQLIANALGNLARYCPRDGRITLAISWQPDWDSAGDGDAQVAPAKPLGGD